MSTEKLSGIILAGGSSRRLGFDKGLKKIAGKPIVRYVIEAISNEVNEIICVVESEERRQMYISALNKFAEVYCDKYNVGSPLIGLITGLSHCKYEYAVVVACDMPFIQPSLVSFLYNKALGHNGAVIVNSNNWIEPFLAVYRVTPSLVEANRLFRAGDLRLRMVLRNLRDIVYVPITDIDVDNQASISLFDVDTEEKLAFAEKILSDHLEIHN